MPKIFNTKFYYTKICYTKCSYTKIFRFTVANTQCQNFSTLKIIKQNFRYTKCFCTKIFRFTLTNTQWCSLLQCQTPFTGCGQNTWFVIMEPQPTTCKQSTLKLGKCLLWGLDPCPSSPSRTYALTMSLQG